MWHSDLNFASVCLAPQELAQQHNIGFIWSSCHANRLIEFIRWKLYTCKQNSLIDANKEKVNITEDKHSIAHNSTLISNVVHKKYYWLI